MEYYTKYLRNRLYHKKAFPSTIEKAIITAIDRGGATGEFEIYVFIDSECYHCECALDSDNRYSLKRMECATHRLSLIPADNAAYSYESAFFDNNGRIECDEYYSSVCPDLAVYNSNIAESIAGLPSPADNQRQCFVWGDSISRKAVRYAIQEKLGTTIKPVVNDKSKLNLKSRFHFADDFKCEPIRISEPASPAGFLGTKRLTVFVPDSQTTLESPFWKDVKWSEIIPNDCATSMIGSTGCFFVQIAFEIDGFGNLFCRADDNNGHNAYSLIQAPWGNPTQNSGSKATPSIQKAPGALNSLNASGALNSLNAPSAPSSPLPDNDGINLKIEEGASMTFDKIFTPEYVNGTEEILIRDSHIYQHFQFNNLRDFISAVSTAIYDSVNPTKLKRIKIVTQRASDIIRNKNIRNHISETPEINDYIDHCVKKQEYQFARLQSELKQSGIEFEYTYNKFHDRTIVFSNGWTVECGRGLDIFMKRNGPGDPIVCKEATFSFKQSCKTIIVERKSKQMK